MTNNTDLARAIYVHCTEPWHAGCGAQSGQVRGTWEPQMLLLLLAGEASTHWGSLLGLLRASSPGGSRQMLLTRNCSCLALLCLLPLPPTEELVPGLEGQKRVKHLSCKAKGFRVGVGLLPLVPLRLRLPYSGMWLSFLGRSSPDPPTASPSCL